MWISYEASKSICTAELFDKSLLMVVLRRSELQSLWVPVTIPIPASSPMISNPSGSHRERKTLQERNKIFGVSDPTDPIMGNTQGKKTEDQINIFSSCFVMTLGLFCIREDVPSLRTTPLLSNLF